MPKKRLEKAIRELSEPFDLRTAGAFDPKVIEKALPRLAAALQLANPAISGIASATTLCSEKPICWGCAKVAANITVKILQQQQGPKQPGIGKSPSYLIQACPLPIFIKDAAEDEVHKQVDKVYCDPSCGAGCRCASLPISINIGHVKEQRWISTGEDWLPCPVARAVCRTQIDIEFDIQERLTIGICVAKEG